jgi:hypothetical protein
VNYLFSNEALRSVLCHAIGIQIASLDESVIGRGIIATDNADDPDAAAVPACGCQGALRNQFKTSKEKGKLT